MRRYAVYGMDSILIRLMHLGGSEPLRRLPIAVAVRIRFGYASQVCGAFIAHVAD